MSMNKILIVHVHTSVLYLKPTEDGCHPLLQVVPSLIGIMSHLSQLTGRVSAVFSGQAAILLVD